MMIHGGWSSRDGGIVASDGDKPRCWSLKLQRNAPAPCRSARHGGQSPIPAPCRRQRVVHTRTHQSALVGMPVLRFASRRNAPLTPTCAVRFICRLRLRPPLVLGDTPHEAPL
jgi:hypothetical protein